MELGCICGCSRKILREGFAELREVFQALARSEQDIFLMAQLKAMNGEEITASWRLKRKTLISERFTAEIAIRLSVRKHVRNRSHSLRKRQKSSGNEWYNTACSW